MQHLLLLHGAVGSSAQLAPLAALLDKDYHIHTINLPGHAGREMPADDFSMAMFANDVIQYLDKNNIPSVSIFGYSMGGYITMCIAKDHPDRINHIITLATKFHWNAEIASRENAQLDAEKIELKVPAFAAQLKETHSPNDWTLLLEKTRALLTATGENNLLTISELEKISARCLLLLGDRDKMVSLEETVNAYKAIPGAALGVLPSTAHPIEKADLDLLQFYIRKFVQQ